MLLSRSQQMQRAPDAPIEYCRTQSAAAGHQCRSDFNLHAMHPFYRQMCSYDLCVTPHECSVRHFCVACVGLFSSLRSRWLDAAPLYLSINSCTSPQLHQCNVCGVALYISVNIASNQFLAIRTTTKTT